VEEPPYEPAHEEDGQEDRGEREGHREDREADLARARERGVERPLARLHMADDVLEDDDRIVDDEADREREREEREVVERTQDERNEVIEILESYGLTHEQTTPILAAFEARPKVWVDWMMRFELGLEEPDPKRAVTSAATIAGSYIAGGLIPLAPYMLTPDARTALLYSVGSTIVALAVFGYVKGHFTGAPKLRSSLRTTAIGGLAAGAAYGIARLIS